jgi:hypothetical protein
MDYQYRLALEEMAGEMNDMMADLEDLRDEAQDCLEQMEDEAVRQDVKRMDAALDFLSRAVELLENEKA